MYETLAYTQEELSTVMRATYGELIEFITSAAFLAVLDEMDELDGTERPGFVLSVLLDDEQLARRGVHRPDGVLIQRSAFGDRRPTLFVVKKFLPPEFSDVWQNANITFDNEFESGSVSRDVDVAWRPPLPVDLQAQVMAEGGNLEDVDLDLMR